MKIHWHPGEVNVAERVLNSYCYPERWVRRLKCRTLRECKRKLRLTWG